VSPHPHPSDCSASDLIGQKGRKNNGGFLARNELNR
jgi:hypothetical protein